MAFLVAVFWEEPRDIGSSYLIAVLSEGMVSMIAGQGNPGYPRGSDQAGSAMPGEGLGEAYVPGQRKGQESHLQVLGPLV